MILSISQYIEALENSDGRFRSLSRFYPVTDESGFPSFAMLGHRLVDFEIIAGWVRRSLRCPLRRDADAMSRLRALYERDRGSGSEFYTEWELLEREVVLFDDAGQAFEVDILSRPTPVGEKFTDFLENVMVRGETRLAEAALRSFEELVEWADNAGRSGISPRRLLVTPDGSVSLTSFSATDETPRAREMLQAAARGEGVSPAIAGEKNDNAVSGYDALRGESEIKCVRDDGGWRYVDGRGTPVLDAVWLAAAPFREGRAEVEAHTGKGLIDTSGRAILNPVYEEVAWDDYWGLVSASDEGRWSLLDRDGTPLTTESFDWLSECSEGFVLAQKDGKCGFVNVEGRLAIPCIYDEAYSFTEGCALVTLGRESFLIDPAGRRIH